MFACIHATDPRVAAITHAALLDCAAAFSPRVEDTAVGTVTLDIEGLDRLFGSTKELAQRLQEYVAPVAAPIRIGIASNPEAAICAARAWIGITILPPGSEASRFKDLNIELLPMDPETQATLTRWGIHTFGALARLPVGQLSARLGQQSVHLHRLARGVAVRPLRPCQAPLHFEEVWTLDDSITTLEPLAFILNRLCDILFLRLRSRGLATLELRLTLKRDRPHEPFVIPLQLPVPARSPRVITRLFMLSLERRLPGSAVHEICLQALPSKPRVIQNGLFVPTAPEPEKLELTLARIAAIVGNGNIGAPKLLDAHARQRFELKHFGEDFGQIERRPLGALRLFRPPCKATVRTRDGIPAWMGFSALHGDITAASGPWKSSGEWWNSLCWVREEWDVEIAHSLLRIFLEIPDGHWFVEGVYD